jgi:hypothetical protein
MFSKLIGIFSFLVFTNAAYAEMKQFQYSISVYDINNPKTPILEKKNTVNYNNEKEEILPASFFKEESSPLKSDSEYKIKIVALDFPRRSEKEKFYTHRVFFGINDGFYPKDVKKTAKINNHYKQIFLYPEDLKNNNTYQTEVDQYLIIFTIIE